MPDHLCTIRRHPAGFVRVRVDGVLDRERLLKIYEHVLDQHPGRSRLWDYRGADLTCLTQEDLAHIADHAAAREWLVPTPRVAIVVGRPVEFGISRVYEVMADHRYPARIEIFRDEPDAVRWLVNGAAAEGAC